MAHERRVQEEIVSGIRNGREEEGRVSYMEWIWRLLKVLWAGCLLNQYKASEEGNLP